MHLHRSPTHVCMLTQTCTTMHTCTHAGMHTCTQECTHAHRNAHSTCTVMQNNLGVTVLLLSYLHHALRSDENNYCGLLAVGMAGVSTEYCHGGQSCGRCSPHVWTVLATKKGSVTDIWTFSSFHTQWSNFFWYIERELEVCVSFISKISDLFRSEILYTCIDQGSSI